MQSSKQQHYLKHVLVQDPQALLKELHVQELPVERVAGLLLSTSSLQLQFNLADPKHSAS